MEVNKVKSDVISKLVDSINEDPEDPPPWWDQNMKSDVEGAMFCLLMTGVSEPGLIEWFEDKFASVVSPAISKFDKAKRQKMGKKDSRRVRCDSDVYP